MAANQTQTPSSAESEASDSGSQGQPASTDTQGAPSSATTNFSQLLEQQIAQAIQPVLNELWRDVTQTVGRTVDQEMKAEATTPSHEQSTPPQMDQGPAAAPQASQTPAQQKPSQPAAQQAEQQQPGPSTTQAQEQPAEKEKAVGPVPPRSEQAGSQGQQNLLQQGLSQQLGVTLRPVLKVAEQQSEQWLQAVVVAGLTALLSEPTHAAIQQRAEQGLHELLQKAFEALPGGANNHALQTQTEVLLQAILRDSLDAIYSQGVRAALEQQGEQAVRDSLHRDFGGALRQLENAAKAMTEALVGALRHQWPGVLRLLLQVILKALEISLEESLSSKPAAA